MINTPTNITEQIVAQKGFNVSHSLVPQLTDFQKFLLQQIQQLQNSTLSKRSTSNVVAVQNNYGTLKQSIINYYLEQKGRKKTRIEQMSEEIMSLKSLFIFVKNSIQQTMKSFKQNLTENHKQIFHKQQRIVQQNLNLKEKLIQMGSIEKKIRQENKDLRLNLKEWQQAKELRKLRQQQKNDPSLSKIQKIIKNKLEQDSSKTTTPLKEFNLQHFISKRPSGCNSTAVLQDNQELKVKSAFRGSQVSSFQGSFAKSLCFDVSSKQNQHVRHSSKQKLKVFSIQS